MLSAARPSPAMDRAEAAIARAFSAAAEIDRFKRRCRQMIRWGASHPAVCGRYWVRARLLRQQDTAGAADIITAWYATEKTRWRRLDARLSIAVLRELRLIIRFMRARKLALQPVIADVLGEDRLEAAE
jgi:hypothetical protein